MQINEDIDNRLVGSTSSNDSGVIIMDDLIQSKNLSNMKINNNEKKNIINNNHEKYNHSINDNDDNNIYKNEIRIEDLDDVVSIRNLNISHSQRSSTIYSSSNSNVSINSINNNNKNNNHNNDDDDNSTLYDSDSDFIEELGDKVDNNNGIVSVKNAIGLNEDLLENGRVVLDQKILGQNNNNNNNNISVPSCVSNSGVNINSLSFSGTNNGVNIGPKFICHDLVIKQYVQKSPKQQFRKFDSNTGNVDGTDNPNFQYNGENFTNNSNQKNNTNELQTTSEKPKLFSIKSKATLITGSIILLIIVLGAITFATLEIQRKSQGSSQDDHNIGDGDDSRKHIPVNSTIGDELITAGKVFRLISRDEWIAQPPNDVLADLELPATRIVIAHTATEGCTTQAQCTFRVRLIQTFHIESRGWDDIAYNFLVGGDGAVYEGRGWDKQGAHTKGYNVKSIGVAFIGTFNKIKPTEGQLDAAKLLIREGLKLGKLSKDYKMYAHRQLIATESPGDALFNIIKNWSHYSTEI